MSTEITVRGTFSASQPPERATVRASISYEGPSKDPVYTQVAQDLAVVQASVAELKDGDGAAVTWWSAERLRTWSSRPWNQDGEQLPLVHHAGVGIQVKFRDFAALTSWVGEHVINIEGFQITDIVWSLTAKRHDELIREVRERAVRDAVDRAQLYADALGRGAVSPVAIADAGMLSSNRSPDRDYGWAYTLPRGDAHLGRHGSDVDLVPEDIEVSASVDARFVVEATGSSWAGSSAARQQSREPEFETGQYSAGDLDVGEFRDDDGGYLTWIASHPHGYVLNILRSYSANQARIHRASCPTISGQHAHGTALTRSYVKICADDLAVLDRWTVNEVGETIPRCPTCFPPGGPVQLRSPKRPEAAPAVRHQIRGPSADSAVIEAWADDYIRFQNLPAWQHLLKDEIRRRCRTLTPSAGQVLHATFFGAKPPKSDIENVLLYNIGSFREAGCNGIRFEHGSGALPEPDNVEYGFGYRYALAPRSGTFAHWRQGRMLAEFSWTDLGTFSSEKQLAQVWLALSRGEVEVFAPAAPETPFAVRVEVRPPSGHQPVWGGLVKGIFDGVICAFQAHTDKSVLPDVAERLAAVLPADSIEIEGHLLEQRRAVLGAVDKLVTPHGGGVMWHPSDHLCVAGELLAADPATTELGDSWAIRGEICEVTR